MTHITHNTYYDEHIFDCTGHTGYKERGSDPLCAAVSILCLTLCYYLEEAAERGLVANLMREIEPGEVHVRFVCPRNSEADKCFYAIMEGFKMLSESFPEHIFYED